MNELMLETVTVDDVIVSLRGQNVIIDRDVAVLYGVTTREVNQAVKNNPIKFPKGYLIELTESEKLEVIKNFDNLGKLKYTPSLPTAFTEKGLYMLATILKSPKAAETTIAIVETFANIRELSRAVTEISETTEEEHQKTLLKRSGEILGEILGNELKTTDTETSIELNLAVIKVKHTVKRKQEV